jgi:hypothetical protein
LPLALEGTAEQFFVAAAAVHVGGIEEVDAELQGAVQGADRFRVLGRAVEL